MHGYFLCFRIFSTASSAEDGLTINAVPMSSALRLRSRDRWRFYGRGNWVIIPLQISMSVDNVNTMQCRLLQCLRFWKCPLMEVVCWRELYNKIGLCKLFWTFFYYISSIFALIINAITPRLSLWNRHWPWLDSCTVLFHGILM